MLTVQVVRSGWVLRVQVSESDWDLLVDFTSVKCRLPARLTSVKIDLNSIRTTIGLWTGFRSTTVDSWLDRASWRPSYQKFRRWFCSHHVTIPSDCRYEWSAQVSRSRWLGLLLADHVLQPRDRCQAALLRLYFARTSSDWIWSAIKSNCVITFCQDVISE